MAWYAANLANEAHTLMLLCKHAISRIAAA